MKPSHFFFTDKYYLTNWRSDAAFSDCLEITQLHDVMKISCHVSESKEGKRSLDWKNASLFHFI